MLVNMKILYATETGNARDVAERVARECSRQSINKISLASIDASSYSYTFELHDNDAMHDD